MSDRETEYDPVTKPSHYCHGGIECADLIEAVLRDADLDGATAYWAGLLIKYAVRWPFKGRFESEREQDLDKAVECARRAKECYEAEQARKRRRADEIMKKGR